MGDSTTECRNIQSAPSGHARVETQSWRLLIAYRLTGTALVTVCFFAASSRPNPSATEAWRRYSACSTTTLGFGTTLGFLFGKDESVPHVDVADAPSRIHQNRYKELSAFCYHNVELHAYPAIAFVSHSFAYRAAIMTSPISIAVESDEDTRSGQEWPELDSKSLTDDMLNYEYSNGRRYHSYRAGAYLLPNDEVEQERMDMLHHIWKLLLGGYLTRTPLDKPGRILDVGTGTGSWAVEAADQWPSATVIGTDLSPIQPSLVPANCHFLVDDAEGDWNWEPFDFIHGRSLCGSIGDWPRFYQQCFDNLKPGGCIEMQEHDAWINCAPTGKVPPFIANWNVEINAAFWAWGKGLNVADKHVKWMKEAGFVDVDDQIHQCPIGPWAKDPRLKEVGKWFLATMLATVEPYTLEIYTRVLGKTLAETQVVMEMIKKEFRDKKNHLYGRYHFITARKPIR